MNKWFCAVFALVICNCRASAQTPLRVDVRAQPVYLPGLPLLLHVDIVNTSEEVQQVDIPKFQNSNLWFNLKREGSTDSLVPTINYCSLTPRSNIRMSLKPHEKVSARFDPSVYFQDDLPVGKYTCEVLYDKIKSEPIPITIAEPVDKNFDRQRDLRLSMTKFLAAKVFLRDENRELARLIFADIEVQYRGSEYGRMSNFYLAQLEKEPAQKIVALKKFLADPSPVLPNLLEPDDLQSWLGRFYFETGDLKAAKEIFLKAAKDDLTAKSHLKKIDDASEATPKINK